MAARENMDAVKKPPAAITDHVGTGHARTAGGGPGPRSRWLLPRDYEQGWTRYAWLFYLVMFFVDPVARSRAGLAAWWLWPLTAAGVAVFLASYIRAYWRPRELLFTAALQSVLAIAFAPINLGSSVFFVYAASFAAQIDDGRRALRLVLLITAVGALTSLVISAPTYFWITAVGMTPFIGGINLHFAQVRRAQRHLKLAQDEVRHLAQVAERERIARDLHDVLGHTLSLIILKSELASKLAERDPARALREMREVEVVARKALQEVRETIRGYRATLAEEIERARSLLKAGDVATQIEAQTVELSAVQNETLALALREAVTNVVRHARAGTCRITVTQDAQQVLLEVRDDGQGGSSAEGTGLRGMRERIESLGGTLLLTRTGGMQLSVRLPVGGRDDAALPAPSLAAAP